MFTWGLCALIYVHIKKPYCNRLPTRAPIWTFLRAQMPTEHGRIMKILTL